MDWIVQKATELGVSKIIPVISEHTEVRIPPNKSDKKLAHWQSIAIAAAEQAKRQSVPRILTPLPLPDLIENRAIDPNAPLFVLSPDQGITLSSLALTPTACQCLIGPEGGFSDKEMAMFAQSSAHMVKMGPRVLRTETAALTAIGLCQGIWGDLK